MGLRLTLLGVYIRPEDMYISYIFFSDHFCFADVVFFGHLCFV